MVDGEGRKPSDILRLAANSLSNGLWWISCRADYKSFQKSVKDVEHTQRNLLREILSKNQYTQFGQKQGFEKILRYPLPDPAHYQEFIPLSQYRDYQRDICAIGGGKRNVLTSEPVLRFEPSSGSTSPSKMIPLTMGLKKEFQKGISVWIYDLFQKHPELLTGRAYWSITPIQQEERRTKAGIPIGFEDDKEYLGFLAKKLLKQLLIVPSEIAHIKNIETFRYITLLFLVACRDLALISIWNPTFLSLLLQPLTQWLDNLVRDLQHGTITPPYPLEEKIRQQIMKKFQKNKARARELRQILKYFHHDSSFYEKIWPQLKLISAWADAAAGMYLPEIQKLFPHVRIQGKGLLATEGFVSFPLGDLPGYVLSVESHFFEFIPLNGDSDEDTKPKCAWELYQGEKYSVVLTTSGGLYRYRLHDIIEVTGFYKKCPLIRFLGKEDNLSDLFGEKLHEEHVSALLQGIFRKYHLHPLFSLLGPEKNKKDEYYYTLYLQPGKNEEDRSDDFWGNVIEDVESGLKENFHYQYCRKISQLHKCRFFLITNKGNETFLKVCRDAGQKIGNIKPSMLSRCFNWSSKFIGKPIGPVH